jgi:P4 family phage/plasmid primase-like protien
MSGRDPRVEWLRLIARLVREDAFAVLSGRDYLKRDEPLTDDVLDRHLNGGPHVGGYIHPQAGGSDVSVAVFDLDDHGGEVGWDRMREVGVLLWNAAISRGLNPWPVRSGGGHGIHLWLFWEDLQAAAAVRKAMSTTLAEIQFKEGTGGVGKGQIEIFPKSDSVAEDGYGNLVGLPFARASVPLDGDLEPCESPIPHIASQPVPEVPEAPPQRKGPTGPVPIEWVKAALAVIPNADAPDDRTADFDKYVAVGMAVFASTGGSEDGFAAWDDWARQHPLYNRKHNVRKAWLYWRRHPPSRTGWGALLKRAREMAGTDWLPPGYPIAFSEQWLALEFVRRHEHDLRFTALWNRWHHWVGTHWQRDDTLRAFSLAQALCRDLAARSKNKKMQMRINDARTRAAIVTLARENPALATTPEEWNGDPWLLGTSGGVVDLRTGQLRPAAPEDRVTMTTAAAPGGDCPLFKRTILEICDGDDDLVEFLQRWWGYCLTGLTREEKLIFFVGDGGNGKGTIIETVAHVMGDYAVVVAMTTLLQTRHQEHPTEIAKLFKARLAVASETSDGGRINAARVKLLTGGDKLTGRYMRADYFDFTPTHKLVVSGNRPLIIGRRDRAIERRWNTVKFKLIFKDDTTLKERLREEASGILAWLIEGCLAWQRDGLATPKSVIDDTEEYLAAQDDLGQFIAERCETDNPEAKTLASEIYWDWRQWSTANGVWAASSKDFRERMASRFKMTNTGKPADLPRDQALAGGLPGSGGRRWWVEEGFLDRISERRKSDEV